MAARFWRWVIGFSLIFAAVLALLLALTFSLSTGAALAVGLLGLITIPLTFTGGSFILARILQHERCSTGAALGTVCTEAYHFTRAILAMSLNPRQRPATAAPPSTAKPTPVLLIHGFLCNRAVWQALDMRLQAAGFGPIVAANLEPLFTDIDLHARHVEPIARELQRKSNGARVTIIAHSMGGLVARSLLRQVGHGVIARIVTLACPHHGSRFVQALRWPATRQMSPGSSWLLALNSSQEWHLPVPVASIYSLEDNLVAPARSAHLPGAQMHELRGIGHLGMLSSRLSLDCVMSALPLPGTT